MSGRVFSQVGRQLSLQMVLLASDIIYETRTVMLRGMDTEDNLGRSSNGRDATVRLYIIHTIL